MCLSYRPSMCKITKSFFFVIQTQACIAPRRYRLVHGYTKLVLTNDNSFCGSSLVAQAIPVPSKRRRQGIVGVISLSFMWLCVIEISILLLPADTMEFIAQLGHRQHLYSPDLLIAIEFRLRRPGVCRRRWGAGLLQIIDPRLGISW
jgi:hypothetical protein